MLPQLDKLFGRDPGGLALLKTLLGNVRMALVHGINLIFVSSAAIMARPGVVREDVRDDAGALASPLRPPQDRAGDSAPPREKAEGMTDAEHRRARAREHAVEEPEERSFPLGVLEDALRAGRYAVVLARVERAGSARADHERKPRGERRHRETSTHVVD